MVSVSIEDNFGKLIVLVGVLLLVLAVLWFSALFGSVVSAVSLFFGIVLVFFGLGFQLGLFSGDMRNLGGVGTVLISVSVVCFAFSMAAGQLQELYKVMVMPEPQHLPWTQTILGWLYVPVTRPLYAWFSGIMLYSGLAALIPGIVFKGLHSIT